MKDRWGSWDWDTTESIPALGVTDFCLNCHEDWPCRCDDPARGCGICAGPVTECKCSERQPED